MMKLKCLLTFLMISLVLITSHQYLVRYVIQIIIFKYKIVMDGLTLGVFETP